MASRYCVSVRYYPEEDLPFGVEVWDNEENERDEEHERKFDSRRMARACAIYLKDLLVAND